MNQMSPPTTLSAPGTGVRAAGRFSRELGYLLMGLPVGASAFVVAVTGFVAGTVSLAVFVGLPMLAGALLIARGFAGLERRWVEAVTGRTLPPHRYRKPEGTRYGRMLRVVRDGQSWRDLMHMLIAFPLRIASFCIAVTWTVGGLGELLYGAWSWALPRDPGDTGLLDLMYGISSRSADIAFNTGIGVVLLATAIPVVRALAALQAGLARGLLTSQAGAPGPAVFTATR